MLMLLTLFLCFFRLGRRAGEQSKYPAAYLSRTVSSWQRNIRRYGMLSPVGRLGLVYKNSRNGNSDFSGIA